MKLRQALVLGCLAAAACAEPLSWEDANEPKTAGKKANGAETEQAAMASASSDADVATAPDPTSNPAATASAAPAQEPTSNILEDGADLVFQGLKLTSTDKKRVAMDLKPDGKLLIDGKPFGRVFKNTIEDDKGAEILAVRADDSVTLAGKSKPARFDKDVLVTPNDDKMWIEKDGVPSFTTRGKTEKLPMKFSGVTDKNRRAAVLLAAYMMTHAKVEPSPPTTAGAAPGAPAATPPASTARPQPTTGTPKSGNPGATNPSKGF